jgi:hypothetical protein
MVDFTTPVVVLNNRKNKIALVLDTAVPLTNFLPRTEAVKVMKYENLVLEIKNIWKRNNVSIYTSHLSGQVTTKLFTVPKEQRFNQQHLQSGGKMQYYYKHVI